MIKVKVYRNLTLILMLMLISIITLAKSKIPVSVISSGEEKYSRTGFILSRTIGEPFISKTVSLANQHNIRFCYVYKQSTTTEVKKKEETMPTLFKIEQNYPNPFNPSTKIKYSIPDNVILSEAKNLVRLKVYDILGKEITTLIDEYKPAGEYEVEFNASSLPSGVYFYQLKAGEYVNTKKMNLLK